MIAKNNGAKTAKKILIAEDEASLAKALALKLGGLGFGVKVATDGEEALVELKKNHYDLLLLDLMMPKLDGFGVLAAMKTWKSKPLVLISSNLSQKSDRDKAIKLGAKDFLVKADVSLKAVVETINKMLK